MELVAVKETGICRGDDEQMYKTVPARFGVALVFLLSLAHAQIPTVPNATGIAEQSDPQAVEVVEKAIRAMGGREGWKQAGGATAQAVITPKDLPARTVDWSDDWSKGRLRFRRDSAASEPSKSSLISSETSQVHLLPNGKIEPIQRDNGIVVLAIGYPAPALILSQSSKYACTFHLGRPANPRMPIVDPNPDEVTVTERCPEPFYPKGLAILTWVFSAKSDKPASVELPTWGQMQHTIHTQTVSYAAFQTVDGLLVPSELKIQRASGAVDVLTISKTAFVQGIADETFQSSK
jgi:hypothetical protein